MAREAGDPCGGHRDSGELVTDAVAAGAQLRAGGAPRAGEGWFSQLAQDALDVLGDGAL